MSALAIYHSPRTSDGLRYDSFFCLFGIVLGYANDRKAWFQGFLNTHFTQLHAMVILGAVLEIATFSRTLMNAAS